MREWVTREGRKIGYTTHTPNNMERFFDALQTNEDRLKLKTSVLAFGRTDVSVSFNRAVSL